MNLTALLTLRNLIRLAGLLHFCQIPAMMFAPGMLGWKEDIAKLSEINRNIVKVIGGAIVLVVIGTGIVVLIGADQLAAGGRLAAAFCAFLGVFWLYRGTVQVTLYAKIWPGGLLGRLSYLGLSLLFFFLTAAYCAAFAAALRRGA
jgi:uncharacterized protein YjeT (DUF2065 family)